MVTVRMLRSWWVTRTLEVDSEHGRWVVEYRGYYLGSEAVFVDGQLALRKPSHELYAMVPRFEFRVGPHSAQLDLAFQRMWTIFFPRISMVLQIDGEEVYREGRVIPRASARFS